MPGPRRSGSGMSSVPPVLLLVRPRHGRLAVALLDVVTHARGLPLRRGRVATVGGILACPVDELGHAVGAARGILRGEAESGLGDFDVLARGQLHADWD